MFGSATLDIAIGLVLVFLLVSLMLTAVTEAIEALLKTRAADLEQAIGLLLKDPNSAVNGAVEEFYNHPLIFALFQGDYRRRTKRWWLAYRETGGDMPSYIPRDLFSTAALDLYKNGNAGAGLTKVIESLEKAYGVDLKSNVGAGAARAKVQLESWYDGVMDRASGWYKRRTHKLLFWLGLVTAIALNINPISITQYLAQNATARDQLAQLASQVAVAPKNESPAAVAADEAADAAKAENNKPPLTDSAEKTAEVVMAKQDEPAGAAGGTVKMRVACAQRGAEWKDVIACQKAIAQVGLPIGWSDFAWERTFPKYPDTPPDWTTWLCWILAWVWAFVIALFGWSLTGLAATLGAPFWFDALNKIMVIRATVKPKEKSGDESSEDRQGSKQTAPKADAGPVAAPAPAVPAADDDGAIG